MLKMTQRPARHLGTYYYVGTLVSPFTCGHKHATVRTAMGCRKRWAANRSGSRPVVFMAHLGMRPGKPLA